LDLQSKYNSSLPTDVLHLVMAYNLAKQSFSGNNLEAWTGSVLKQWNKLCTVKKYYDDEYLAVLPQKEAELRLTLQTKNSVWNEWAANYCTHSSDPKNFKVSPFMVNVLEKLRLDTLVSQHHENGKAQAAANTVLTTVSGAVAQETITVLSMVVRAFTEVSMLTTVMVAKHAKMVILLLSLALNVTRNLFLACSIRLVAFLASKRLKLMIWLTLHCG